MSYTAIPHVNPEGSRLAAGSNRINHSTEEIELEPIELAGPYHGAPYLPSQSYKDMSIQPDKNNQSQAPTNVWPRRQIIRNIWLTAWFPAIAFVYIALCYAAATRVVPIRVYGIDQPLEHLYMIKAGVTTASIIIIAIAILPAKELLDDLKSEEFFRRLHRTRKGVLMDTINNISLPSHGYTKSFGSIFRCEASRYFVGAIVLGFILTAVSSLAPAALSVGTVSVESDIIALRVGALAPDSVYYPYDTGASINSYLSSIAGGAASLGWVQATLGINVSFIPDSPKYAVPLPLDLTSKDRVRWVTDVVVMNPICGWATPDPPLALSIDLTDDLNIRIPAYDIGVDFPLYKLQVWTSKYAETINFGLSGGLTLNLFNLTTNDPPIRASVAWILAQCEGCVRPNDPDGDRSNFNFDGIPTQRLTLPKYKSSNDSITQTIAILVCEPRSTVETREVRTDGTGTIRVVEDGRTFIRQGNLLDSQIQPLMGRALDLYTSDSGPDPGFRGIGRAGQVHLLFGLPGNESEITNLTPRPVEQIAQVYGVALQAAMTSYLSGSLGSALVPGRIQTPTLILTSSLPHVVVSTILSILIALFINLCHFRSKGDRYTFFSVAAALSDSNMPAICADVKEVVDLREEVAMAALRERRVHLFSNEKGRDSLSID